MHTTWTRAMRQRLAIAGTTIVLFAATANLHAVTISFRTDQASGRPGETGQLQIIIDVAPEIHTFTNGGLSISVDSTNSGVIEFTNAWTDRRCGFGACPFSLYGEDDVTANRIGDMFVASVASHGFNPAVPGYALEDGGTSFLFGTIFIKFIGEGSTDVIASISDRVDPVINRGVDVSGDLTFLPITLTGRPIPEPAAVALWTIGLVGIVLRWRTILPRRRRLTTAVTAGILLAITTNLHAVTISFRTDQASGRPGETGQLQIIIDVAPEIHTFTNGGLSLSVESSNPGVVEFTSAGTVGCRTFGACIWSLWVVNDLSANRVGEMFVASVGTQAFNPALPGNAIEDGGTEFLFGSIYYKIVGEGSTDIIASLSDRIDPAYSRGVDVSGDLAFLPTTLTGRPIPEPATVALWTIGLVGIALRRRALFPRRRRLTIAGTAMVLLVTASNLHAVTISLRTDQESGQPGDTGQLQVIVDIAPEMHTFTNGGLSLSVDSSNPGVVEFIFAALDHKEIFGAPQWSITGVEGISSNRIDDIFVASVSTQALNPNHPGLPIEDGGTEFLHAWIQYEFIGDGSTDIIASLSDRIDPAYSRGVDVSGDLAFLPTTLTGLPIPEPAAVALAGICLISAACSPRFYWSARSGLPPMQRQ